MKVDKRVNLNSKCEPIKGFTSILNLGRSTRDEIGRRNYDCNLECLRIPLNREYWVSFTKECLELIVN